MATNPSKDPQASSKLEPETDSAVGLEGEKKTCLASIQRTLARGMDEVVRPLGYRVVVTRPLHFSERAVPGILRGIGLSVEVLDTFMSDLWADVLDDSMTAEQAVSMAHERILEAAKKLGFGTQLRRRYFRIPPMLPPSAELGRICELVSQLSEDLAALNEQHGEPNSGATTFNVRLRSIH